MVILGGVPNNGQMIVARNTNVSVREGGNIKGIVIANSLLADGDTSITYGSPVVPISKPIPTTPKTEKVIGGIDLLSELFIEDALMEIVE
ncbi:hypothetical protein [Lysinibacillus antri]|uniref:Uncharacterized protein n=1 Tax=Lysinibacillus antri TaxID=2498145 RepID=A0A3S0P9B8_9BACI|nr:hypothetical protein [Lysinibacillus antri]RUL55134.1 hypothetical protein EK386_05245 [Lysinibacillus antri]